MARLFAKVFQHDNFTGQHRFITEDVGNISTSLGFNDTISSIIVYRGNDYVAGDKIRFYEHPNFEGGYLDLEPGSYRNIHVQPFSFGDKISSVDFHPPVMGHPSIISRLRIRVYEHVNYGGQYRDLLQSLPDFGDVGLNDKISSLRVFAGEDYGTGGWVCDFFENPDYTGPKLQPGSFAPGAALPNISVAPYSFNDRISSMRIYQAT
jgi:hypothetical protein